MGKIPTTPARMSKKPRSKTTTTSSAEQILLDSPKPKKRKVRRRIAQTFLLILIPLALFSYLTNPFVRFSIIIDPYKKYEYVDGQVKLETDSALIVQDDAFFRRLAQLKSGWHIVENRFSRGGKAQQGSIDDIIREIHEVRFDPSEPYLISGDHFSQLYPRSLGIFYQTLLDPRTALDEQDWKNRQLIYLKTTAYALQAYEQSDRLSTTIVPIGPRSVVLVNYYAPPSDTLYSLLFALKVMQDSSELQVLYPFGEPTVNSPYTLDISQQANTLFEQHKPTLQRYLTQYFDQVYDPKTGLVRKDILLSGTKDIAKRSSAFYDNVVFWRTMQLAQILGLSETNPAFLDQLKHRILAEFWLEDEGYFLEDLSEKSIAEKYYSSDWLVALMTGFLDPRNPEDRPYIQRSVAYIQRNAIDQPFGLQYHPDIRKEQRYFVPGWVAPAYGATAIWSHWGMEYIKTLVRLAEITGDEIYLQQADVQLSAYTFNMKRYLGYPEVYTPQGDFFSQTFYKSVRRTGWVVNFEQARAMYEWVRENWQNSFTELTN